MNARTLIGLLSLLYSILQCHCYGPVSQVPVSVPSSPSENNVLNFANSDYGYVKPVAVVTESPKPVADGYWWLNKKSPFVAVAEVPANNVVPISNEVTSVKYEANPFINSFAKENSCNGYNCVAKVPCVEEGYICAPQYLCQNGVINKNKLNQISSASKFCAASKETCCKISYECEGSDCYHAPSFTQTVAIVSTYPSPSQAPAVSSSGYTNPEYVAVSSYSPVSTPAPTPAPYTGPQNTTPYPGCAAALKCVPDNYCTLEGVMSDIPVVLTKESLLSRVPLSECLDVATGIIGKCCRDPNYKDPWPDHDSHDHGHDHGHDHSHEHVENTEAPQTQYTIKKPIGGYQTKPGSFVVNVPSSTDRVVSLQSYSPSTESPKPVPSYSIGSAGSGYQYQVTNTYVPPAPSSQVYVPPSQPAVPVQTYIPPQPAPTYSPPASYVPPQPAPTYSPPASVPAASYVPPQPAPTYSPPVASYVPPQPTPTVSQPVPSYVPPTYSPPQPVASYVPPQQPQTTGGSYYKPYNAPLSRYPLEPPLLFASDRVYEKSSTATPFVNKQQYYSQCGAKANDGTEYGEAPWHAVIYSTRNKDLICGGAIVSENAILTSAHCLEKGDSDSLVVQVGASSRVYKIAVIVRHPQYDSISLSKDLALAILKEAIKFDSYTQKICLPSPQSQEQSYNKECYASTLTDYYNPETLQKIKIQSFPYKDCAIRLRNTYLGKYFVLNESFTCASTPSETDLCQIKSGEPLACDRGDGIYELYGIKSWDLGCQEYKKSAIFSNNDVLWVENTLVAPLEKLITIEQTYQKEKFKGDTLEGVNIQEKPGFALGYGK